MSLPIGVTPVLTGKEARRFLAKILAEEHNLVRPVPTPKLAEAERLIREYGNKEVS